MKKTNKGTIWNALGSTMYGANSFVMLAFVSRVGTVEQAGYFGIAFTTAQMLYILGLFGASHYQMTDYSEKYNFSEYAKLRFISCIFVCLACALSITCLGFSGEKRIYTIALTVLMLLNVVGELYQCLFFQKNRLDLSGSALFFRTFWSLTAFCICLSLTRNVILSICLQITTNLLVTLYYIARIAPAFILQSKDEKSANNVLSLMKECLPLLISTFLMNLLINAPKYGIELIMDDAAQGYFNMIFMPVQVINLCAQFIFKPMLGHYSAMLQKKQIGEFWDILKRQLIIVLLLTLVCCTSAYIFGIPVLGWLYNKDISAFRVPLTLLVLGGGVYAVCQLFYYILVIIRKQRSILVIYILSVIISAFLVYAFVAYLGLIGAAVAFFVSHTILLAIYFYVLDKSLKKI